MTGVGAGAVLTALIDHAHAIGSFEVKRLGEFKSAPPSALCFAVWVQSLGTAPSGSGLAATTALMHCTAQIYFPAFYNPESDVEIKVTDAADAYLGRLNGAFTLGGLARNIDLLGEMGEPMLWEYGHVVIDKMVCRTATLQIYVIFNDVWVQNA